MDTSEIKFDHANLAALLPGSIAENARRLGISRQHMNNILKGRKVPSGSLLLRIQSIYGLSAKQLAKFA